MGAGESKELQGERAASASSSSSLLERVGGVRVRAVDVVGSADSAVSVGEARSLQEVVGGRCTVLHIMRRFGCALCRHGCQQISLIAPTLYRHNVALVGIGLEQQGLEPFVRGRFWAGELYIDEEKRLHTSLGLGRKGLTSGFGLLSSRVMRAASEARKAGVQGDFKGDGLQLGATYVIDANGVVLAEFKQEEYGDHPTAVQLLDVLGIVDERKNETRPVQVLIGEEQ